MPLTRLLMIYIEAFQVFQLYDAIHKNEVFNLDTVKISIFPFIVFNFNILLRSFLPHIFLLIFNV